MNWLKRLFCRHRYEWMRNIYGDEINLSGGKRSLWGCGDVNGWSGSFVKPGPGAKWSGMVQPASA